MTKVTCRTTNVPPKSHMHVFFPGNVLDLFEKIFSANIFK